MKIVVTYALDWEFKPWRKIRVFRPDPRHGNVFYTQVGSAQVSAILTGVGAANAQRTLNESLGGHPDFCIISGLAGGLKTQYRSGDILTARAVRRESDAASVSSDESLFERALACGASDAEDFISVARVARTPGQKRELGTVADAVDMESFTVMEIMRRQRVPSVAIRAIADDASTEILWDFDGALDKAGRLGAAGVIRQVARAPQNLWALAKFAIASSRAASSLAHYLDAYVTSLSEAKPGFRHGVPQVVK